MAYDSIATWWFNDETDIPADVPLVPGEEAIAAYTTLRDVAVFTTKRLIVRDAQGLTGKKKEIYSLPYSSITMWSSENAGKIDLDAEVELWTRAGRIKVSVGKKVDVRALDQLISRCVRGA